MSSKNRKQKPFNPPPFRPHSQTLRRKGNNYTVLISGLGAMIALAALPSLVKTSFKPLKTEKSQEISLGRNSSQSKQKSDRPTVDAPILQNMGPTGDGSTKIELTNSIPHTMVFTMKQEKQEKKGIILKPCPECKIYTGSVPENACDRGTTETFSVEPGEHLIRGSWENADIADIAATWKLAQGRKYGLCIVMDLAEGRNDWDHK
jgi:hypothetical protein